MKNLQEMAIGSNLTNLQIMGLNEIACAIEGGEDDYFSYEDTLSPEEDAYLLAWLVNRGVYVIKDKCITTDDKSEYEAWLARSGANEEESAR